MWFRFDPGADLFVDATANTVVADCAAEICPVSGSDRGLQLDGVDDMLTVADPLVDVAPPLTVTVWASIGAKTGTGWKSVVARAVGDASSNSWQIGLNSAGDWAFVAGNATATESLSSPVDPGASWVFLALRHDGQQLRAWVDGISVGEVAAPPVSYDEHPLLVGADSDAGTLATFWSGGIDDLRVYGRGLDDLEVIDVMAQRR